MYSTKFGELDICIQKKYLYSDMFGSISSSKREKGDTMRMYDNSINNEARDETPTVNRW